MKQQQKELKRQGTSLGGQLGVETQFIDDALARFNGMKDKELKRELEDRDLSTKGGRDEYMERLTAAIKKEAKRHARGSLAEAVKAAQAQEGGGKPPSRRLLRKRRRSTSIRRWPSLRICLRRI